MEKDQVLTGLDICSLDIKSDLAGHDFTHTNNEVGMHWNGPTALLFWRTCKVTLFFSSVRHSKNFCRPEI